MLRCLILTVCFLAAGAAVASDETGSAHTAQDAHDWKKVAVDEQSIGDAHTYLDLFSIRTVEPGGGEHAWDRFFTLKTEMYNGDITVMRTLADYRVRCRPRTAQRENVRTFMRSPEGKLATWPSPSEPVQLSEVAVSQMQPIFDEVCNAPTVQ